MQRKQTYTIQVITHADDLMDAKLGEEDEEEEFKIQVHMVTHADGTSAPMLNQSSLPTAMLSRKTTAIAHVSHLVVHRRRVRAR